MLKFNIRIAVIVLATALSEATYAAPPDKEAPQKAKPVRSALNDFYGSLSDEQKARFEAIGPQRTSQLKSLDVVHTTIHRRGVVDVGQVIRR